MITMGTGGLDDDDDNDNDDNDDDDDDDEFQFAQPHLISHGAREGKNEQLPWQPYYYSIV